MADYAIHDTTLEAIADTIRKKDGTQALIDPADYADRVNLLGLLEIKTASGAIASFADGADGVPVKSCSVSFTPSGGGGTPSAPVAIVGHSGITLTNKDNMSTPTHTDTYTDTFGQTIYGGTRDLTTDKASVKGFKNVFNEVSENVIDSECYNFNKINGNVAVVGDVVRITFNAKTVSNVNRLSNTYSFVGCNVAPHLFNYASDTEHFYINTVFYLYIDKTICGTTAESVFNWLVSLNTNGTPLEVYMEYTTSPEITGLTPHEIDTLYGDNNIYADIGTTTVEYRSSGTTTPIVPTLISKSITQNGTYDAEDDNADGYDEVTVAVPASSFIPTYTETQIVDNSSQAASFTLSQAYGNFDMIRIVFYNSYSSYQRYVNIYTTPDILDEIFDVAGKIQVNDTGTNRYACYTKNGLEWTRSTQRTGVITAIYGITFTNCSMTATDLYKRGALTTTAEAITSQTSLKQYDLFVMASITNTDGTETTLSSVLYEGLNGTSSAFGGRRILTEYNQYSEGIEISEYGMTAAKYFMVQGVKFTPNS